MCSLVVVVDKKARQLLSAFGVGLIGPFVGPLVGQDAVEPFGFAIGLGAIGAGGEVTRRAERRAKELGQRVVLGDVGHHSLDLDAELGEVRPSSFEEPRAGVAALVGEHLDVGAASWSSMVTQR